MSRYLIPFVALSILVAPLDRIYGSDMDKLPEETDRLWRRGRGAEDGAFTSVASSMIAWGVGLGVVIALVAVLVEQSTSPSHSN